ncbi:Rhodanese-like protein [Pilatotrama ljubarskyi]|nr:Rhodanese-like protein [Pilatotrama ljubarskyi]
MSNPSRSRWTSSSSTRSTSSYGEVIARPEVVIPAGYAADPLGRSPSPDVLSPIREQVAQTIVLRSTRDAETVEGTKVGVILTLPYSSGEEFLNIIASELKRAMLPKQQSYLFILALPTNSLLSPVLICASSEELAERAGMLVKSKFLNRVHRYDLRHGRWGALIRDLCTTNYDEAALWDAARKAARAPLDPLNPPPGSRSISQILEHARARLQRITPQQAYDELQDLTILWPVVLVDIRPEAQRREFGSITGALVVERNVLEWRFDPRCAYRLPIADRYDIRVIIFCQESYTSSLAAASLHDLGLLNATDMIGGYAAWKEAGLPDEVEVSSTAPPTDGRMSVPVET